MSGSTAGRYLVSNMGSRKTLIKAGTPPEDARAIAAIVLRMTIRPGGQPMPSIGDTARQTGLSVDTLRYYEKIGLLPNVARDSGGRRRYRASDLARLRFIQRARRCDFSLDEIRQLLEFRGCRDAARPAVAELTEHKLADIQHRLVDLEQLQSELQQLLHLCQGSDQGCPILEGLDQPD